MPLKSRESTDVRLIGREELVKHKPPYGVLSKTSGGSDVLKKQWAETDP